MNLSQNYFELFKLPQQFGIDKYQLMTKFRRLQWEAHPDRHIGQGKRQELLAMRFSSYINTAYQTLKSPLSRAEYLLELAQVVINMQTTTVADNDFLLRQMQWRETLAEANKVQCKETLVELLQTVSAYRQKLLSAFSHAYDLQNFDNAKECVVKLNFVEKMAIEIKRAERSNTMEDASLASYLD